MFAGHQLSWSRLRLSRSLRGIGPESLDLSWGPEASRTWNQDGSDWPELQPPRAGDAPGSIPTSGGDVAKSIRTSSGAMAAGPTAGPVGIALCPVLKAAAVLPKDGGTGWYPPRGTQVQSQDGQACAPGPWAAVLDTEAPRIPLRGLWGRRQACALHLAVESHAVRTVGQVCKSAWSRNK